MNALKNVEALFLVAVAVAFSVTALVRVPVAAPAAPILVKQEKMHQVIVSAKRLTAAQKAQLAA
jgi:hypothetical protein